jgi:hypothetical protein
MKAPVVRVVGALLIMIAVLVYLFHGSVASMQQQPYTVHSTIQPRQ